MDDSFSNNLSIIHNRINTACKKSGRNPEEVRLLLATKTVNADKINFALQQGESLVGENKVQELQLKCEAIALCNPEVHFIGHLQTNKIKEVIKWASCIESIDRITLAEKLHDRLLFENKTMDVYIQVNTSYEQSKFGVAPEEALELIKSVSKLKSITIKGLMTIGLFSSKAEDVRKCFRLLKTIQKEAISLNLPGVFLKELSMGMSGDLEIAIEEGATIIRVGTAIFGQRMYPDSYYWDESKA